MEWNDIYDKNRNLTGRIHRRGRPWKDGEFGLVVCVWVYDGRGRLLLTRRAKGKSFAGTWENSGGAVQAGENSITAIARELYEETGILADASEFELIDCGSDGNTHYDYYCLKRDVSLENVKLQPGETDAAKWVTFRQMHEMIQNKQICYVIAHQFRRQEQQLLSRQSAQV